MDQIVPGKFHKSYGKCLVKKNIHFKEKDEKNANEISEKSSNKRDSPTESSAAARLKRFMFYELYDKIRWIDFSLYQREESLHSQIALSPVDDDELKMNCIPEGRPKNMVLAVAQTISVGSCDDITVFWASRISQVTTNWAEFTELTGSKQSGRMESWKRMLSKS